MLRSITITSVMPRYPILCYAMLCYAMPCHATSVDARVCADTVPSAYRPMSAFMPDTMPLDATPEHGQRVLLVLAFTTPRSRHFRPGTTVGHRIGWRPGTVLNHCPECHCTWPNLGCWQGGGKGRTHRKMCLSCCIIYLHSVAKARSMQTTHRHRWLSMV